MRRRAQRILSVSGSTNAEWSVVFTDDREQTRLNAQHRGRQKTTDVLSFPLGDPWQAQALGDVVISVEQAARQAPPGALEGELIRLLVHGFCHLCGLDHRTRAERSAMQASERRLLVALDPSLTTLS